MTAQPITAAEVAELRRVIKEARDVCYCGSYVDEHTEADHQPQEMDTQESDALTAASIAALPRLLDALEEARRVNQCSGCGGTVGDHLAPDQGGCPGSFMLDGVQMVPQSGRDLLGREREALAQAYRECIDERDAALDRAGSAERERDEAVALIDAAKEKSRRAAQTIIEAIGSVGPEDSDQAAVRIVAKLDAAKAKLAALVDAVKDATREFKTWVECDADLIEGQEENVASDHNRMLAVMKKLAAIAAAKETP